jgi:hypothetical protein
MKAIARFTTNPTSGKYPAYEPMRAPMPGPAAGLPFVDMTER